MDNRPKLPKRQSNDVLRYSGMAFQMLAIIGLGLYGGIKLDQYFGMKNVPVFTLVLTLLSVAIAIYLVVKDVSRMK
jgi:F0F1-type ATP synthase assembly protein I